MISALLHLFSVPFIVISGILAYSYWKKGGFRKSILNYLFVFFLFIAAYQFFLSLPFLLTKNLFLTAWGYNLAIVFVFLIAVPIFRMEFDLLGVSEKRSNFFQVLYLLVGVAVIVIQAYDFRLPIVHESGFIFWNANPVAAWISSFAAFILSMALVVVILKNRPENLTFLEKLKTTLFITASIATSLSVLIYYPAHNLLQVILAFAAAYLGFALFMVTLLIPRRENKNSKLPDSSPWSEKDEFGN